LQPLSFTRERPAETDRTPAAIDSIAMLDLQVDLSSRVRSANMIGGEHHS
jgi:hypothetical protein